jgi:hypothetical protein
MTWLPSCRDIPGGLLVAKPKEEKPSKKLSYVKRGKMPDGKPVIVGAGIYE